MNPPIPRVLEPWHVIDAIALCFKIEAVAPTFGCHIGLTGGLLYKEGTRKDCDILIYSIREKTIDFPGLWAALAELGITVERDLGFCIKAVYQNRGIDFLWPEAPHESGSYQQPLP